MKIKIGHGGRVTLPAKARQQLRLKEGGYIEVRVTSDSIVMTPEALIDESQAYFWTPEWQAAEREASADIQAGRVHEFRDVEDLIASLRRQL